MGGGLKVVLVCALLAVVGASSNYIVGGMFFPSICELLLFLIPFVLCLIFFVFLVYFKALFIFSFN
jgi:hypothetical protein